MRGALGHPLDMAKRFHDRWLGEVGYTGLRQVRKDGTIRWRKKTIPLPAAVLEKLGTACEVIVREEEETLHFSFAEYPSGTKYAPHAGADIGSMNWWKVE